MAAAISASVRVPYVVDLKVIVFVSVTVFSPFRNTIAESCVRGLGPRLMLADIPVIGPVIVVSFEQYENIPSTYVTLEKFHPDKFNEVSFEHELNIEFILVTEEVSKLDKSNEVSFEHKLNI